MITIPTGLARPAGLARPGELPIVARHAGLTQVGHITRDGTRYTAILWERAGQRQEHAEPERVITGYPLGAVRQALRDRVRTRGKWWA